jgi:formate C-acetyltransferase
MITKMNMLSRCGAFSQKRVYKFSRYVTTKAVVSKPLPPHLEVPFAINVAKFVNDNYKPYYGDETFLTGPTERTERVWKYIQQLMVEEHKKGILDVDVSTPSSITAFAPGYINKDEEIIVGLQTDAPLKRAIKPFGGINMVKNALTSYGYELDPKVNEVFTKYRKTHNSGVFDAYTEEMRKARKSGILTGLPDAYGRGRIIGDYRRVALYGVDALIEDKEKDLKVLSGVMNDEKIRLREEVAEQIKSLKALKEMAATYGFDVGRPAKGSKEAVQWLYMAYLAAVKDQDGAAMSLGRIDSFLDIYFEEDLKNGVITEEEAQEIIDDFVIKLRIVRQLRTPEYNALFAGDPTWVTASMGGLDLNGRPLVTKTTYRILNTLYNLNPSPEPNITILWSKNLPENFKRFCSKVSIDTSSIQYENDDLMRPLFSSDYAIACCVSSMCVGHDMQFFGARCNMPKLLLYALNQGRDEISGAQVAPKWDPVKTDQDALNYDEVMQKLDVAMDWLAELYCNTMNIIHYMHDKYYYESLEMALHNTDVRRLLAFGISGFSVITDSLSAIKYGKVYPIYDERGIMTDFQIEGDFPKFGNDDDRVDKLGQLVVNMFNRKLQKQHTYRNSLPTLSLLTITSNTVYGACTSSTPDGRKKGEAFAAGSNAMHNRETSGLLASLNSLSKLPYENCLDGISNTTSLVPSVLGKNDYDRVVNLSRILDGYFESGGHHINVNVFNKDTFLDATQHPEQYPNLTVRISGYAILWHKLSEIQQKEFLMRTFHDSM